MSSQYLELPIDLTTQATGKELVSKGQSIRTVTVMSLTPGAAASIALGDSSGNQSKLIPLIAGVELDICPAETDGLFLTTPAAQPGASLALHIGFTGPTASRGVS